MKPKQAINEALRFAGVSGIELSRRLDGHSSDSTVRQWRKGERQMGVESYFRVLDALGLEHRLTKKARRK